ncbi:twin-arginine translocase TatA/TatE family subunit [Georgenia yuyongxinii]|nr:twin-arginine translocase TatA/TatE family subunit [Georgenia yuyongxinii]
MGISGGELVVLLVLAFLLIGPERLPNLAQQLGRLTRELKKLATGAKDKVRDELGPEFDELAKFDPRQYDPRRIVREALMEEDEPPRATPRPPAARRRPAAAAAAGAAAAAATGAPSAHASATAAPGSAAPAAGPAAGAGVVPPAPATVGPAAATPGEQVPISPAEIVARTYGPSGSTAAAAGDGHTQVETYVVPFDDEAT